VETFDNFIQFIDTFPDSESCKKQFESIRWNGKPFCPHCGTEKHYVLSLNKGYKCANKECKKQYNVLTKTIFENTKIPLRVWFIAIYIATNHKKGISSCQLARDLKITQKTAWFILSRVREMLKSEAPFMLEGNVAVDETYIGGKAKNKHKSQHAKMLKRVQKREGVKNYSGRPTDKTPVIGLIETKGHVVARVVPSVLKQHIFPLISEHIHKDAIMVTDDFKLYRRIPEELGYRHRVVNHTDGEYAKNGFNTNSVEGFFSQLKRGIYGIYHQVSAKHLPRYCAEFEFRHNTREYGEGQRFNYALSQTAGKRLKYDDLIKN